jgi:hypothetical protein
MEMMTLLVKHQLRGIVPLSCNHTCGSLSLNE